MNLTKNILDSTSEEQINKWKLDLKGNSDLVEKLSQNELKQVIWQSWAKKVLVNILEEVISWVNINRENYQKPIASSIFIWPSWVWKTLLAKMIQKIFNKHFENDLEFIKINCADFAWENLYQLSRITGASAWYIWSDRKPIFHPDNVEWKWRVILFDEIEKWWPLFWNILLSILDDWTLDIDYTSRDKENNKKIISGWKEIDSSEVSSLKTYFSDCFIIMTSNIWNRELENEISWGSIWFQTREINIEEVDTEKIILNEFAKRFKIEMQWRFDYIVPFSHLNKENAKEIIDQLINRLLWNTLSKGNGFVIEFSKKAKEKILSDVISSKDFRKFWGRYIEWYFKKEIIPNVAKAINLGKFRGSNNCLIITEENGKFVFSKVPISTNKEVEEILDN